MRLILKKTGLCHVCGKSTKLLIHQTCGLKIEANNKNKKNRKSVQKRYAACVVPKFCYY